MQQSDQKPSAIADRRSFLKLAGAVAGGATIAAGTATAAPAPAAGSDGLYCETEHVKRYYDLARF